MDNVTNWLSWLQEMCQKVGQHHLDIIVDQCGMDFTVIPALSGFSPEITWRSLYQGLPEDIYREDVPLLARINFADEQQIQWMYALAREVSSTAPLIVIGSPWPFTALAEWLGACADASHEGRAGIFRFWDTRIFSQLFSHVLHEEEQAQLMKPAMFWSWLDRDGLPALLTGDGTPATAACKKIHFTDSQFETVLCLSDTMQFLSGYSLPENLFQTKEAAFAACFNAMFEATEAGLLFDNEREAWVRAHLTQFIDAGIVVNENVSEVTE